MSLIPGTRIGAYDVVAPLGAGGMGEVYRARDTRLDRVVALKILPTKIADDPDLQARFEREARSVAKLNHPNVLGVYDLGTDGAVATLRWSWSMAFRSPARWRRGASRRWRRRSRTVLPPLMPPASFIAT